MRKIKDCYSFYCALCIALQIVVVSYLLFQAYLYWQMGSKPTKIMDENTTISSLIQNKIHENCIVIYSRSNCPYSRRTKELFKKLDVPFEIVELDQEVNGNIYKNVLREMTGEGTVPRVFINGKFVGGSDSTHKLHEENKLEELINECFQP